MRKIGKSGERFLREVHPAPDDALARLEGENSPWVERRLYPLIPTPAAQEIIESVLGTTRAAELSQALKEDAQMFTETRETQVAALGVARAGRTPMTAEERRQRERETAKVRMRRRRERLRAQKDREDDHGQTGDGQEPG